MAFESPPWRHHLFISLLELSTQLQIVATIYGYCEMIIVPLNIVLVALLNDALAQTGTPAGSLIKRVRFITQNCMFQFVFHGLTTFLLRQHAHTVSTFKGLLAYNFSLVDNPENLTQENRTRLRTDVCEQVSRSSYFSPKILRRHHI
ncbi:uncharacterized protein DEA37_0002954 [Paragonimus westermani]|uniref:Uncharacterized protein n=1 Tax=Paragonimus westermani TaxID=34504 RepID=A0A5J4NWA7_9TREM|nr:uncharacterized protein DEA37_0002954 [Paragonimus westermani]